MAKTKFGHAVLPSLAKPLPSLANTIFQFKRSGGWQFGWEVVPVEVPQREGPEGWGLQVGPVRWGSKMCTFGVLGLSWRSGGGPVLGRAGPGEGQSCVLWGGRRGPGNPNIGQTQKLAQNIKILILVNLAKNVGSAKVRLAKLAFVQTWPKMVWPNLVLAKVGLAKLGFGHRWFGQTCFWATDGLAKLGFDH